AIERLEREPEPAPEPGTWNAEPGTAPPLATQAREAIARLRDATAMHDETAARETVTALEHDVLAVYRPSHGLGRFEDDVAVALAMLAAYDVGADETHLMMAEELMLGVIRRDWDRRTQYGLAVNCEAAVALAALATRGGKAEYREYALDILRDYAATYRGHGVRAAPFVSALLSILDC
ncbi:MAG: hypothetical protein ACREUC_11030, partial [Steroidobacteraceae bacterium]